jgi:rsbT co-antagonist protein RsbR
MAFFAGIERAEAEAAVIAALRRRLMTNRGVFPPARATSIGNMLLDALFTDEGAAQQLGRTLGKEGLSLASLLAAQAALITLLARQQLADGREEQIALTLRTFEAIIGGQAAAEREEFERQRNEIELAISNVLNERHTAEQDLRSTISELSTPIIPIYEDILVLPLVGSIDSRRANEITERLLEAIAQYQADLVILDITGVSIIDTHTANHLLMATRAASLLGSRVVISGIGAEVAQSVVHLGVDLQGLVALANLQAGLAYALKQKGLAIQTVR